MEFPLATARLARTQNQRVVRVRFVNEEHEQAPAAVRSTKRRVHVLARLVSPFHEPKSRLRREHVLHLRGGHVMLALEFVDDRFEPCDALIRTPNPSAASHRPTTYHKQRQLGPPRSLIEVSKKCPHGVRIERN